jgi:AcrR family transcriptional regulator
MSDRQDSTQRRILEAALAAFSQYGYQKVDMAEVAQRAGLSRQGLYKHFPSKEALFRAMVQDVHRITLELAEQAADKSDAAGPAALLAAIIDQRSGWFLERLHASPHLAELVGTSNLLCGSINQEAGQRFAQILRNAITKEVRSGRLELTPAGLTPISFAELLVRLSNGLKSPEPAPVTAAEFRKRLLQAIELLCASLLPAPSATKNPAQKAPPRSKKISEARPRPARK